MYPGWCIGWCRLTKGGRERDADEVCLLPWWFLHNRGVDAGGGAGAVAPYSYGVWSMETLAKGLTETGKATAGSVVCGLQRP